MGGVRIFCFGDSNTYGFDAASYFGKRFPEDSRWPDILAAKTGWEVTNGGLNGRTIPRTAYEDAGFDRLLSSAGSPDVIFIMLGTNDLLFTWPPDAERVALDMKRFMRHALEHATVRDREMRIMLISPPLLRVDDPAVDPAASPVADTAALSLADTAALSLADTAALSLADTAASHVASIALDSGGDYAPGEAAGLPYESGQASRVRISPASKTTWSGESARLGECYRHIARQYDLDFTDSGLWDLSLARDGVHLTAQGHRQFAEKLLASCMDIYSEK